MFKDWNFKALGLKNASSDENMMLIAFVNYFLQKYKKIMHKYYCFREKNKFALKKATNVLNMLSNVKFVVAIAFCCRTFLLKCVFLGRI